VLLSESEPAKDSELIFKTLLEIKSDLNLIKKFILDTYAKEITPEYLDADAKEQLDPSREIRPPLILSEKDELLSILKKHRGNRRKAAEELNMSERTLYRKIEKYGIVI